MRRWFIRGLVLFLAFASLGFEWEGRLTRLRRDFESPDPARRREVVMLLGRYPAAEVRDVLLAALEDPDVGVRGEAAEAIGRRGLDEASPQLLDWLDDPDPTIRSAAARALGHLGRAEHVVNLARLLGDQEASVRQSAMTALATIGGASAVAPLLGRLDDDEARLRVEAAGLLGGLADRRAVVPLIGRARDDTAEVRTAVHAALGELGDTRATAALVQGLRDDAPSARLAAITALGRLASPTSVRALGSLLDGSSPREGRSAIAALARIEGNEARQALLGAVDRPPLRSAATQALIARARLSASTGETMEGDAIVRGLAAAVTRTGSPRRLGQLAEALTTIAAFLPTQRAAPALLQALADGRGDAPMLLVALGATGDESSLVPLLERLRASDEAQRGAVLDALDRYFGRAEPDGRAADPLLAALTTVDDDERPRVVALLGRVGATRALPALRALLAHRDPVLRASAIRAIGAIGSAEGAPAVVELLDESDGRLRFEAAHTLGRAAAAPELRLLLERVNRRRPADRHAIFTAFALALPRLAREDGLPPSLATQVRATLLTFAGSEDRALSARALDTLAAWQSPESAAPLAAALRRASSSRATHIVSALGHLDHETARGALREALTEGGPALRTQAAGALGEHGRAAEAELLLARVGELSWPASAAATFSLARLARRGVLSLEPAREPLCELARSHDPFVRANVAVAFAALSAPPCDDGADPLAWLESEHAEVVRAAAARWAVASRDAGHLAVEAVSRALRSCVTDALSADIVGACSNPALPALDRSADVFAYDVTGTRLLRRRLVALRLADGTVWIGRSDDNGHVRLANAPRGALSLEDPAGTPLEP